MYKICIIAVYFGKLPEWFNLWLKSVEYNPTIDFIIYTDQNIEDIPHNLKCKKLNLEEFSRLCSKKLNMNINLTKPYKCCDLKPVYGVIFEDDLNEYCFWGHCDLDLVFGNIRSFITDEILDRYDKVLPLGHLSLYRNTYECNNYYKLDGSKTEKYDKVFVSKKNYAFDEWSGIYSIYKHNKLPMYDKRIFADISIIYKRFRLALNDKNYNNQVFYWEKGHVYRAYIEDDKIKHDEFIYIHFKERYLELINGLRYEDESFYITYDGFKAKEVGIINKSDIKNNNKFRGHYYEKIEKIKYKFKRILNIKDRRIRNR